MSWICPRCKTNNDKLVCDTCGFDSTMNYEIHRAIVPLPTQILSGFYTFEDPQNENRQLSQLFAQAEKGDAESQYQIACKYYSYGDPSFPQDYNKSVQWLKKAAMGGHTDAQGMLASCYETGRGVRQDRQEAMKWYKKAADAGNQAAKLRFESLTSQEEAEQKQKEAERKKAEEIKRQQAEKERKKAEEIKRQQAEEERKKAEEIKKQQAEAERKNAEEKKRQQAEAEGQRSQEAKQQKNFGSSKTGNKTLRLVGHTALDKPMRRNQKKEFYDGSSAEKSWKIVSSLTEAETDREVFAGFSVITIPRGLTRYELLRYQDQNGRQLYIEHQLKTSNKSILITVILLVALSIYYYYSKQGMPISSAVIMGLVSGIPGCLPGLGVSQMIWSSKYRKYRKKMGIRKLLQEPELLEAKVKRAKIWTVITVLLSLVLGMECMIGEAFRIVTRINHLSCTPMELLFLSGPMTDDIKREVIVSNLVVIIPMIAIIVLFIVLIAVKACSAMLLGLLCAFISSGGAIVSTYSNFDIFLFWKVDTPLAGALGITGFIVIIMSLVGLLYWGNKYYWGKVFLSESGK